LIKVYHHRRGDLWDYAADVDTDNLDVAWEKTNTIDHPWWHNPEVTAYHPHRSSMVGDIFVTDDGEQHQVDRVGFRRLAADERVNLPLYP
jgi:hypothetical protein